MHRNICGRPGGSSGLGLASTRLLAAQGNLNGQTIRLDGGIRMPAR